MNVSSSKGVTKVAFGKREVQTLRDASKLLETVGRCAPCKEATEASAIVTTVIGRFVPVQKELPLDEAPN